jgi:hypothetical protein
MRDLAQVGHGESSPMRLTDLRAGCGYGLGLWGTHCQKANLKGWSFFICFKYPLVMTNVAMENHHF